MSSRRNAALLILLALVPPAHAMIMRHDRDAAKYRELATRYPAVGTIGNSVACTLIAPRWVLGAGHTIENYFNPGGDPFVTFGDQRYLVDKIIVHPRRVNGAVDSDWDLALLRLATPVEGIAPVLLYEGKDEMSKSVTFVGPGAVGTGIRGAKRERTGAMYGARNRIEGSFEHSLVMTFTTPPGGDDLEGVAGAGDSGCPALLEQDGKLYTLGVGSWNSGDGEEASTYETIDAFARVSSHLEWIRGTIATDPPSTLPLFGPYVPLTPGSTMPETPALRALNALVSAFNTGTTEAIAGYYRRFGRVRPEAEIVQAAGTWQELIDQYGRYELLGYRQSGPYHAVLIVRASKTSQLRGVAMSVDPTGDHRSLRAAMADLDALPQR